MMRRKFPAILLFLSVSVLASALGFTEPGAGNLTNTIIGTGQNSAKTPPLEYTVAEGTVTGFLASSENYPVQLGAFRLKLNADAFFREVVEYVDRNAIMIREDGLYKIRITRSPLPARVKSGEPENRAELQDTLSQAAVMKNDTIRLGSAASDSSAAPVSKAGSAYDSVMMEQGHIIFIGEGNPWIRRINYFGKSIAFINALIISIMASIASMLILLVIILMNRRRMEREARLHQYLLEKYQGLIVDYLFGNAAPDDFRPIASDNYRRQVLIDQMIDVSINLKGEEARKLLGLYKHLGLDRDSIARAYSWHWHKKIKGFRELAFMNIRDGNEAIYAALNSSNEILRMEAQIALVRLSDKDPFEFLSHLERPFSLWEQITLHEMLIQHNIQVPSFGKWLTSPNYTVVMFALRMIREFRQKEAEDGVRETLLHSHPSVRQLAVQVAGDLELRSTLETMKRMYKNQDYNICLEIVKAMGKMPDPSMLGFLKLVLDKEDDVQLQIEATKAIENNGEEGVKTLVKLMKSEYKNYNIIVRHVLDRRIF
jgi:HEAT repeats